jgi:exodeoxyribonuclease VII small subunit
MAAKKATVNKSLPFEDALAELETLVAQLEGGETSLEQALAQFERGVALARHCQRQLGEAEQKVQLLSKDAQGNEQLTTFEE